MTTTRYQSTVIGLSDINRNLIISYVYNMYYYYIQRAFVFDHKTVHPSVCTDLTTSPRRTVDDRRRSRGQILLYYTLLQPYIIYLNLWYSRCLVLPSVIPKSVRVKNHIIDRIEYMSIRPIINMIQSIICHRYCVAPTNTFRCIRLPEICVVQTKIIITRHRGDDSASSFILLWYPCTINII